LNVLVTFALEVEFAPWRKLRSFQRTLCNGLEVQQARVGSTDVRVVLTGIGPVNARDVVSKLLVDRPDLCIAAGFAGALKEHLRPGNVIAPRLLRDVSGARAFQCAAGLLEAAFARGARRVETLLSSERIISTVAEKNELSALADAVDMESLTVVSEAASHGVRALAVRAISDASDTDLPLDFQGLLTGAGRIRWAALARRLALRPQCLPGLVKLGRANRKAAVALRDFLEGFISGLPFEEPGRSYEPALQVAVR
jgi:nucleoside phosphorylase